jgi:hypothetical protein
MYRAPEKPCSHIGVMQLRKNAPKNGKRPHWIGSSGRPRVPVRLVRLMLPRGTVRLMLPRGTVRLMLPRGTVRLMLPHYLSVTAHGPYLLEGHTVVPVRHFIQLLKLRPSVYCRSSSRSVRQNCKKPLTYPGSQLALPANSKTTVPKPVQKAIEIGHPK